MGMRTIQAAKKRAQQRVNRLNTFSHLQTKSQTEDRTEVLSTVKRVKVLRG